MRCKIGGNIGTEHADIGHLPSVRRVAAGVPMLDLPPALVEIGLEHGKAARLGDLVGREEAHAILVDHQRPLDPAPARFLHAAPVARSEEHTSELQSLMRISYAVFCLKKNKHT